MWTYCTVFLLSRVVESLHQGWANRSSTSSRDLPLLSGRKRKKKSQPRADTPAYSQKVPATAGAKDSRSQGARAGHNCGASKLYCYSKQKRRLSTKSFYRQPRAYCTCGNFSAPTVLPTHFKSFQKPTDLVIFDDTRQFLIGTICSFSQTKT